MLVVSAYRCSSEI